MHPFAQGVCRIAAVVICLWPMAARAQVHADLEHCASIRDDSERLACYDAVAEHLGEIADPVAIPSPPAAAEPEPPSMSRHWELGKSEGTFRFRAHKPIYLLPARYSGNTNQRPLRSLIPEDDDPDQDIDDVEAKFQLSFKLKMVEGLFSERADLWLGYTQQSHWQVFNNSISRPFRETDYEPELMLVIRTDYDLFGLEGRFINLGVVHQSNGRGEPLSRSWNRIYVQAGLERGGFAFYLRPWYRIEERAKDDDNPDIDDFFGYGDLVMQYRVEGHTLSALVRANPAEGKGAVQLDWTFPLRGPMRGYLQGFTGYGESLIDYNHEQTTIGAGVSFNDWF